MVSDFLNCKGQKRRGRGAGGEGEKKKCAEIRRGGETEWIKYCFFCKIFFFIGLIKVLFFLFVICAKLVYVKFCSFVIHMGGWIIFDFWYKDVNELLYFLSRG